MINPSLRGFLDKLEMTMVKDFEGFLKRFF